jgi:protein-disulfide isomerase
VRLALAAAAAGALLAADRAVEGNAKSPVRVIVYEDLQCPDCAAFRRMMDEHLLPRYGDRVAFEHRDFPLARHAWARKAAAAARFFDGVNPALGVLYRRHILETIRETTADNFEDRLSSFADRHGIDSEKARRSLADPRIASAVESDYQDGVARGVAKTPTVFVDGEPFIERFALEAVSKSIDEALARHKK